MIFPRYLREKLFPTLISRTTVFFFLMCLLTLFLYAAGTVQNFIDSTQIFLLRLYTVLGIFLAIIAIPGIFINLGRFFKAKKWRYLLRTGVYLLFVFFGAITVLAVLVIITMAEGNGW